MELKEFLRKLDIDFKDITQYERAVTHTSYANEHNLDMSETYERLEFLGDAVLQKVVSKWLFNHSSRQPGEMTLLRSKLVRKESLASIGRELGLQEVMRIGKGENRDTLADSVLEDGLEALVGAIESDLGSEAAEEFVDKNISWRVGNIDLDEMKDFKTKLQELLQAEKRSTVVYETHDTKEVDSEGRLIFESTVVFDGTVLGKGTGVSKKKAETEAAKVAYEKMVK